MPADKETFPPMEIGGILYGEKSKAGMAISEACSAMTSPDQIHLGEYRGFQMTLSYESYHQEFHLTLAGALSHTTPLGTDIHGNIMRIDNKLNGLADSMQRCEGKLADVQTQLEAAKGEVGRLFPQEQEFAEKSARLKEVNILLNMDKKDREIIDVEPDELDVETAARDRGWER
jgi:hypothetical protein